jgi:TRAP-type C4-dicarboxylate transport system substrate-binding protein
MASSASAGTAALSGCTSLIGRDGQSGDNQAVGQIENPEELPEVEMTHAHLGPPDETLRSQRVSVTLKNYIEEATDGRFTVNIAPGGEIGGTQEIAEQVQNGTIESAQLTGAHLAPFYSDFNCYAGAYMFRDVDLGLAVMDGPFGDKLRQGFLDATGARIYGWFDTGGFQSFSNSVRPLESVEDFEGLSVRTMSMGAHQEICRILGMSPEPFDITQLYEALDQGVYDSQKNAVETVILFGFNEGQNYITFDEHQLSFVW